MMKSSRSVRTTRMNDIHVMISMLTLFIVMYYLCDHGSDSSNSKSVIVVTAFTPSITSTTTKVGYKQGLSTTLSTTMNNHCINNNNNNDNNKMMMMMYNHHHNDYDSILQTTGKMMKLTKTTTTTTTALFDSTIMTGDENMDNEQSNNNNNNNNNNSNNNKGEDSTSSVEDGDIGGGGGGTATISAEVFNLIKGIVGAGVLALPSGIASFGSAPSAVIPAILFITTIGALSSYGFGLIGRSCALTKTTSYRSAWGATVNKSTDWIPAWSVTLKTIFATLAYSMILKDTFTSLFMAAGYNNINKSMVLFGITTFILLPLCLLKDLSSLAPFSLLGSMGMLYTAVAMLIRFLDKSYQMGGKFALDLPISLRPSFGDVGAKGAFTPATSILIGMLSTAYMAHFNAPKFYTELKNNTIPRYLTVVNTSFAASIAIFAAMTGLGFLTFGANSSGLILNNYSPRDKLMGLSKIAVALSLVFSYPLAFVGARDGLLDLLKVKNQTNQFLNTLTVAILGSLTALALIIPDVSFVMAFAGSTLGNALIYIFPAIMFRGAINKLPKPTKLQKFEVKAALASALLGFGFGVMGVVKLLQSTV